MPTSSPPRISRKKQGGASSYTQIPSRRSSTGIAPGNLNSILLNGTFSGSFCKYPNTINNFFKKNSRPGPERDTFRL